MGHGIDPLKVRRPGMLLIERRALPAGDLRALLSALAPAGEWIALAPHLDDEVALDPADLGILAALPAGTWVERATLERDVDPARVAALLAHGLLLGDHAAHAPLRDRDDALAAVGWWPPAAVAQRFGRWRDVDVAQAAGGELPGFAALVQSNGMPPPACPTPRARGDAVALPPSARSGLDALLGARATCRNFAPDASVTLADLACILQRSAGAQAVVQMAAGVEVLKKHSPSGGGLHPIEAHVLVQRVEGLRPGLYHYHAVDHALEPHDPPPVDTIAACARRLVAGQPWFADAPVIVLLAARFARSFWKYRNHPKAWRVIQLDAGHLSQTLQLSATELGLGAFVTAAIDDACAEALFGLDGVSTGAIAACGFGPRAAIGDNLELDPLGRAPRG